MIYRVLESLKLWKSGRRIPAGTVGSLRGVSRDAIQDLLRLNRIAEVHPPPLEIIPGFEGQDGTVAERIEDPATSDEDRAKLMKYIATPTGFEKPDMFTRPYPATDYQGCLVPEPITELDEDGERISYGLSDEEVEKELAALDPSLGTDDNAELLE